MSELIVTELTQDFAKKYDSFIMNESFNGTFLQSRMFLDYHLDRFHDNSLLFLKDGTIIAACPAVVEILNNEKMLVSHPGSTFGGLVISKNNNTVSKIPELIVAFENYIQKESFKRVSLKMTSDIFCYDRNDLLFYYLWKNGYGHYDELSFCLEFPENNEFDVVANFESKTRNLYRKSLTNGLIFKEFSSKEDIGVFYEILTESLQKHNAKPVHSYDELIDLYENRIHNYMRFFGVYYNDKMIAGSMVFIINGVFHTQYLCALTSYLNLKPMDFLDANLIQYANRLRKEGIRAFSFGISTENHGHILNENLAKYKYGFGTNYYLNKTFYKEF